MMQKTAMAEMRAEKMIDMFTYKIISEKSIDEITQEVPDACEKHKFALLQTYNYHEIVEKKGYPIQRKVYIYEICQAKTASLMLTDHPEFSLFMPCKLAVYEDKGGTVISTMNMELVLNAVSSNPPLYEEATTLYKTLKDLMKSISENQ